ncbi:MAG: NAD(P)-dependent alcohol dehydrogenase [Oceanospirillaceae bacterium]|nr:NAD(P)-dependent alcohol dehydrogenase [Oceanospirillaceae bacterium]
MQLALVLEKKQQLSIRNIEINVQPGADQVTIAIDTVGICGSDVHYYSHGRIGPFAVNAPMVLGHEAAGTVVKVGSEVQHLSIGDRVCMEPGVPKLNSRASRMGIYNVDPAVVFWATPPVHGCLTAQVVHHADFTYKLPPQVSFSEGALVEPFAIGMQAAVKAKLQPGDTALVIGAGTIGIMTAIAAIAGGCSKVYVSDIVAKKLEMTQYYPGLVPIDSLSEDVSARIMQETADWGVDVVFECSGANAVFSSLADYVRPGGCIVFVGMPMQPVVLDLVAIQAKELRMETVFRYANVYERAINFIASGKVDLKPLISETYNFEQSISAFERAAQARDGDVKIQIKMPGGQV